jgi:hypothetical protein
MAAGNSTAQVFEVEQTPRAVLGGSVGLFRISFDKFTDVYDSRVGPAYGGSLAIRVWDPYFLMVAGRTFSRDGKAINTQDPISWTEKWINIGARRIVFGPRVNSYVGFGFSFFRAEEDQLSGILKGEDGRRNASGFFLDLGVDFRMTRKVAIFINLELTSATSGGFSGFEAGSIGGFFFGTGIHLYPF